MKKEMARRLSFVLLSMMIAFSLLTLVSAMTADEFFAKTGSGIGYAFNQVFGTTFGTSAVEMAIVKFLFFLLIFLIIYAVSDLIPLLETHPYVGVLISAIVAWLSVMYITPTDFYTILISYTTLGITIGAIIPLAVLLALSYKLALKPTAGKVILQKVLLGVFALVLVYRVIQIWGETEVGGVAISPLALPVYGGTLVIIVLLIILNAPVRKFILSSSLKTTMDNADTLGREESLAQAIKFDNLASYLTSTGATAEAQNMRDAAERMRKHATSMSRRK